MTLPWGEPRVRSWLPLQPQAGCPGPGLKRFQVVLRSCLWLVLASVIWKGRREHLLQPPCSGERGLWQERYCKLGEVAKVRGRDGT